ncbi:hypothetical protein L227DRAFT_579382 [Lentinus tigrinus ALCF2SS1-6]|uniref:Uncharacterized protein n=1 Tax=Lentinus tigrinus ALCF2SS1-6 TaxID=1328759 RepID=A0A5C2RY50_9APHY|nr:hypothetical protein L227DRAFT_579382 [Lentinus tigrinus ALCF2SS1-6]
MRTSHLIPAVHRPFPSPTSPYSPAMLASLRRTQASAQAFSQKIAPHLPAAASQPAGHDRDSSLILPLSLHLPKPITTQLISLGVEPAISQQISSALVCAAESLQKSCMENYQRRAQLPQMRAQFSQDSKLPHLIISVYSAIYNKVIGDWTSYILRDFVPRLLQAQTRSSSQHATSLLEELFSTNLFPTQFEKYELASKCEPDYRQVHNWSQNCEGLEFAQKPASPLVKGLEESTVQKLLLDDLDAEEGSRKHDGLFDRRDVGDRSLVSYADPCPGFHLSGAEHAFPTAYPPQCSYDPFPMSQDVRSFPRPWLRTPSSPQKRPMIDVAELTAAFAKLSVADSSVTPPYAHNRRRLKNPSSPFVGFNTPCSRAPHPAFIRRTRRTTRTACASSRRPTPTEHTPSSRHLSVASPIPSAAASPVQQATSASPSPKRTLPHRVPKHPPAYRPAPGSPPYPNMRQKSSVSSRVSSTLSSSTLSSSGSDVESPLMTPLLLPDHELPDNIPSFDLRKVLSDPWFQSTGLTSDGIVPTMLTLHSDGLNPQPLSIESAAR